MSTARILTLSLVAGAAIAVGLIVQHHVQKAAADAAQHRAQVAETARIHAVAECLKAALAHAKADGPGGRDLKGSGVADSTATVAGEAKGGAVRAMTVTMNPADVLGPNNLFHDDMYGVSMTYPEGWTVDRAIRWGRNGGENTVFLSANPATSSHTSMYYQQYPDGAAPPMDQTPQAYLNNLAQWKQQSRVSAGFMDYANVPDSFAYAPIDGHPALSYYAAYSDPNDSTVKTEYFIRILGTQGYVMFFTQGTFEDVEAAMPQIQAMANSVKLP